MKIHAPNPEYTGQTVFGETVLEFKDGVADHDGELPHGVRQYMQGAGYGLGKRAGEAEKTPAPADPRDVTFEQGGTPLRDAAVDPHPGDFLPPTNAGKDGEAGNPHGPNVVAPQIHASSGQPVVPGPVGTYEVQDVKDEDGKVTGKRGVVKPDNDAQEARETEYAERALVGDELVPEVLADMGAEADGTPNPNPVAEAGELKGAALDEALDEAGLSKSGTADEKRQRLADHRAGA